MMFIGETEKDWSIIAHYQYNKKKNSSRSTLVYILSFKKSVKKRQEHDYKNVEGITSLQVTCISYICCPNSVSNSV